jgi:hypothetical protein
MCLRAGWWCRAVRAGRARPLTLTPRWDTAMEKLRIVRLWLGTSVKENGY